MVTVVVAVIAVLAPPGAIVPLPPGTKIAAPAPEVVAKVRVTGEGLVV
jgi:hypothetical protein